MLLINNRSYSDAEIFPHAFRTLGLGKLVGQPTGGLVIGTRSISLIDGSTFRIPRIGVTTLKGVNMEKEGVKPDVLVERIPTNWRGHRRAAGKSGGGGAAGRGGVEEDQAPRHQRDRQHESLTATPLTASSSPAEIFSAGIFREHERQAAYLSIASGGCFSTTHVGR